MEKEKKLRTFEQNFQYVKKIHRKFPNRFNKNLSIALATIRPFGSVNVFEMLRRGIKKETAPATPDAALSSIVSKDAGVFSPSAIVKKETKSKNFWKNELEHLNLSLEEISTYCKS